ncbi:hypothetical protein MU0083_000037 [[Mycobacterium] kokjensenii]|uniref:Ribbon-helix-helix protein CopG domain-containing protein n=1 Tax=[Mycobacterium] kokjensenii TaxID=3064287 RepID=A0ABM9L5Z7_9MYCO|nr:hypothetical protein [Mycolicibacter sp. MU0083]CAJ1492976.1 hypothetical protein MU0083_000037 [Mycolicibacter sp. MU0083]
MTSPRPIDYNYADLAADYAANPPHAAEIVGPVEVNPAYLPTGRPARGKPTSGKTPALPVRLPEPIRSELRRRVGNGEAGSESELVRSALLEYFENHPRN